MPSTEFNSAVSTIEQLNEANVSNQTKLKMYALYKQVNVGDCNTKRPGMFDLRGRAKWDAWKALKGMDEETASAKYISLARSLGAEF